MILITGATGFLGSALARRACARGEQVRVLVRPTSDRRRLDGLPVEFAEGDVTDAASVAAAVDGVTVVHHAAAFYEIGTTSPERMAEVNVGGSAMVFEAARAAGALCVHVSSVTALGATDSEDVRDESWWAPDAPPGIYARTKRDAHILARRMIATGARIRIAVPGTIYGPDDPSRMGQVHRLLASGGTAIGLLAAARQTFVHVDDCAEGLLLIAENGRDGQEYLLANAAATMREWYETMAEAAGTRKPVINLPDGLVRAGGDLVGRISPLVREAMDMLGGGAGGWNYTSARAIEELGWSPRPLLEGLQETAAWYQEHQPLFRLPGRSRAR